MLGTGFTESAQFLEEDTRDEGMVLILYPFVLGIVFLVIR